MVKRLYVDNFRCLVNFSIEPGTLQLFVGRNGAGKSTVFDILTLIREFVISGASTTDLFPLDDLTRWQSRDLQTFEVSLQDPSTATLVIPSTIPSIPSIGGMGMGVRGPDDAPYHYRLAIEHDRVRDRSRVAREQLHFGDQPLFLFENGEVRLFRDDGSEGPAFSLDWSRSGLGTVPERHDNRLLSNFKRLLAQSYQIQINPWEMIRNTVADREDDRPLSDVSNLAAWFRHLSQEEPDAVERLRDELREVLDGLETISLEKTGEKSRSLRFRFRPSGGKVFALGLADLSEGQRCVVALFAVVQALVSQGATLCIDEPDNFLALAEIQPWLMSLVTRAENAGCQVLLISHHPELIDYLAPRQAMLLERSEGGPTRVLPFAPDDTSGLSSSELVARGWENG